MQRDTEVHLRVGNRHQRQSIRMDKEEAIDHSKLFSRGRVYRIVRLRTARELDAQVFLGKDEQESLAVARSEI